MTWKTHWKQNLGTKIDSINTRLNEQALKINDLGQRVEKLEKHIPYADAAKSPPKPPIQNKNNTNTETNTATNTNQQVHQVKNHNLIAKEIMSRSKNIIGIFQKIQRTLKGIDVTLMKKHLSALPQNFFKMNLDYAKNR